MPIGYHLSETNSKIIKCMLYCFLSIVLIKLLPNWRERKIKRAFLFAECGSYFNAPYRLRKSIVCLLTYNMNFSNFFISSSSETLPLSSTEAKLLRELRNNCSVRRHLNILLNSESVSALVTAMQDLGKHVTSSACHLNTGEIIEDITHYIEGQAMLKR